MSNSKMNDAWSDDHLVPEQIAWIRREHELLAEILDTVPQGTLVDCGSGNSRIFGAIRGKVTRYTGVDIEAETVETARAAFSGEDFEVLQPNDFRNALPAHFRRTGERFGVAICTGNTLGVMPDDDYSYVTPMATCANAVFVSVCRRGAKEVMARLGYYQKNGINCDVDWQTNTITSETWGPSRAWDEEGLTKLGESLQEHGYGEPRILRVDPIGLALWTQRIE